MKAQSLYSLIAACGVAMSGALASAAVVTVNFTGEISTVLGTPYAGAAVGDTFSGTFSYESSTAPTSDNEAQATASYLSGSLLSMTVTVQTVDGPLVFDADILEGPIAALGNPKAGQVVVNDDPDIFNEGLVFDAFRTVAGIVETNQAVYVELSSHSTPDQGLLSSRELPESLDFARANNENVSGFQISGAGSPPGTPTAFNVALGDLLTFEMIVASSCEADFNNTNGVTVQDIFDFLTAWLGGNPSADFNGINGVTVQDIFDFLTAWLAGC